MAEPIDSYDRKVPNIWKIVGGRMASETNEDQKHTFGNSEQRQKHMQHFIRAVLQIVRITFLENIKWCTSI